MKTEYPTPVNGIFRLFGVFVSGKVTEQEKVEFSFEERPVKCEGCPMIEGLRPFRPF